MRSRKFLALAFSLVTAASVIAADQKSASATGNVLSLCEALEMVGTGEHRTLTVSAIYLSGLESSFLYDPKCQSGAPATWVEFVPKTKHRRELDRVLEKSDNRAYVQFVGEFYGPKPINPDTSLPDVIRKSGRRYGHLGGFKTMLMVHSIRHVEPVPKDVPFFVWPKESNDVDPKSGNLRLAVPVMGHEAEHVDHSGDGWPRFP